MNNGIISTATAPLGRVTESGLGREGALHGTDEFLELQTIDLALSRKSHPVIPGLEQSVRAGNALAKWAMDCILGKKGRGKRYGQGWAPMNRLVIAITGATGAVYGLRLLEMLSEMEAWETHLVMSQAAVLNIREEFDGKPSRFEELADKTHNVRNVGASIASGSFVCEGMVVAPCSMKTLAAIANGLSDNLISRAADVMLKERKKLVLMTREAPLNLAHLRNMTACTEMGAVIFPPVPAFYSRPKSVAELVDHNCMRVLDQFGIHRATDGRWQGLNAGNSEKIAPIQQARENS